MKKKIENQRINVIRDAILKLENGEIAAIKGLGGFNFASLAFNFKGLQRLRTIKNRQTKSFALMAKDLSIVKKYVQLTAPAIKALTSAAAPIVLLKKKNNLLNHISPDNNYLGFILPYTPIHHQIFKLSKKIDLLIMTSANKKDEPIAIDDNNIHLFLQEGIIDFALSHNRAIIHRADDSILQFINNEPQIIRRSRGLVPLPFNLSNLKRPEELIEESLSVGANLKNTFALRNNQKIYLSQHIGDLEDQRNYYFQNEQINQFQKLLEINPKIFKCDQHPHFNIYNQDHLKYLKIYHHHAHFLSCLGEHNLLDPEIASQTLGIICDGTGLGPDNQIWGFEFLKINYQNNYQIFTRMAHLKYFSLPGGDRSIKEIDRIAISLLYESRIPKPLFININKDRWHKITMLIDKKINTPLTSSLGRLFDGIAALLGIIDLNHPIEYEAQAAILLQKYAENKYAENNTANINPYTVLLINDENSIIIDYFPLIKEIITDLGLEISSEIIAYKFHLWVVEAITKVIKTINSSQVVFSGGSFQNNLLTTLLTSRLDNEKIKYYFNQQIPTNDAGIAFGQACFK